MIEQNRRSLVLEILFNFFCFVSIIGLIQTAIWWIVEANEESIPIYMLVSAALFISYWILHLTKKKQYKILLYICICAVLIISPLSFLVVYLNYYNLILEILIYHLGSLISIPSAILSLIFLKLKDSLLSKDKQTIN